MNLPTSSSDSITSVAKRIRDRAEQLAAETTTLRQLEVELEEAMKMLASEKKVNEDLRTQMLTIQQKKIRMELDCIDLSKQIDTLGVEQKNYERQIAAIEDEKDCIQSEWEQIENDMCNHLSRVTSYKYKIESQHAQRERKRKRHEERLRELGRKASSYNDESSLLHKERASMRQEIQEIDDREELEDEEMSSLALQIKSTMAKRSSLRSCLEDAEKVRKEENENLLKWERECMEFTH